MLIILKFMLMFPWLLLLFFFICQHSIYVKSVFDIGVVFYCSYSNIDANWYSNNALNLSSVDAYLGQICRLPGVVI